MEGDAGDNKGSVHRQREVWLQNGGMAGIKRVQRSGHILKVGTFHVLGCQGEP